MVDGVKHVVIVSQHYPPDNFGMASRIHDTAVHLVDEGWEVTVLAPPPAFPHGQFERSWKRKEVQKSEGVTAYRLWAWQPVVEDPGFISRMAYYLTFPIHAMFWLLFNRREYDVVLTTTPPIFTGFAALPLGLLDIKPWIVDVRDLWIDASIGLGFITEGGLLERLSRAFQRLVLRTADRITVTTKLLGERLEGRYGVDDRKIIHLPNGVDTLRFQPGDDEREPVIVYTGNLGHAQDLESCIRAMIHVNHPEAAMRIVGDGDVKSDLESLTVQLDLGDRVEFTGLVPREEIPHILRESMIGIAPLQADDRLDYAIPTKVYEYMACEVPVVATGAGEVDNLMEESGGGIVVENDENTLANAFETLLDDRERRKMMGDSGRELMVREYDRRVVAIQLSTLLDEVSAT